MTLINGMSYITACGAVVRISINNGHIEGLLTGKDNLDKFAAFVAKESGYAIKLTRNEYKMGYTASGILLYANTGNPAAYVEKALQIEMEMISYHMGMYYLNKFLEGRTA